MKHRGLALALLAGLTFTGPALGGRLVDSNSQWMSGGFGNGYFASNTLDTNVSYNSSGNIINQLSALTRGGAYYSGPYGDSGVQASLLTQRWTIQLDGINAQSCSIGTSGFTCTVSSGNVTLTRPVSNFGASYPTSTSLGQRYYTTSSGAWRWIQYNTEWRVRRSINGTVVERFVGNSNLHGR